MHAEDIGPELAGTTFTLHIPLQSTMVRPPTPLSQDRPRIAILSRTTTRATACLKECWQSFGYNVQVVSDVAALVHGGSWNYVWAELDYLNENTSQFNQLLRSKSLLIFVPYDTHDSLESLPALLSAPNFVMLPKPLIWHTFDRRITASKHRRQSTATSQALRFAPEVEVINENDGAGEVKTSEEKEASKVKQTILIVEDNPVCSFFVMPAHLPTNNPDQPKTSKENASCPRLRHSLRRRRPRWHRSYAQTRRYRRHDIDGSIHAS